MRLDTVKLERSVERLGKAMTADEVTSNLGIPRYCLAAFVRANLFQIIDDPDAALLAGASPLYDQASISAFSDAFEAIPPQIPWGVPLRTVLAGRFNPEDWIDLFNMISTGDLKLARPIVHSWKTQLAWGNSIKPREVERVRKFYGARPEWRRPLIQRLFIDPDDARIIFVDLPGEIAALPDQQLSANEAATLLGVSPIYISELIDAGKLALIQDQTKRMFPLNDIRAFDAEYILTTEIRTRFPSGLEGGREFFSRDPAFSTRHICGWYRKDFSEFLEALNASHGSKLG